HAPIIVERQLLLLRRCVRPEIAERTLHIATIRHLEQHRERLPHHDAGREACIAEQRLHGRFQNVHPAIACVPSRFPAWATMVLRFLYSERMPAAASPAWSLSAAVRVKAGSILTTSHCCDAGCATIPASKSRSASHCPNTCLLTPSTSLSRNPSFA